MGCLEGEGAALGFDEGDGVGRKVGIALDLADGVAEGFMLGDCVATRGLSEGALVEGCVVGFRVSAAIGLLEGPEGRDVGVFDGPV